MTTDPRTMTTPTFAPGDVLQRGRDRVILIRPNNTDESGEWECHLYKQSILGGHWRWLCPQDSDWDRFFRYPHVLVMDGWTHTPGPNNPQAGEVK